MSRTRHNKNRRNQGGAQQLSGTRRQRKEQLSEMSSGAMPTSMSGSATSSQSGGSQSSSSALSLASTALDSIKSHPMPYALAGIGVACAGAGLAWLLVSTKKHAFDEQGNALELPQRLQASMKDVQTSVKGATRSLRRAGETAGTKVSQLASQTKRIEQSVEDMVREHPIACGAALLATGAAIAMAIPRSTLEDTWLGRERDQVVSSAQKLAQGAMQKAQTFAKQMSSSASNGTANAHA